VDFTGDNNNAENEDDDNDAGVLEQHLQERWELDEFNTQQETMGGALASSDDAVGGKNKYVNHLSQCSGLKLLQERRAKKVLMGQRRSWADFTCFLCKLSAGKQ